MGTWLAQLVQTSIIENFLISFAALLDSGDIGVPTVEAGQSQLDSVIGVMFLLAGGLAVIFIIVGALRYVTAAGSPEKMQQAKGTVVFAIVGLIISMLAYAIVAFVIGRVG